MFRVYLEMEKSVPLHSAQLSRGHALSIAGGTLALLYFFCPTDPFHLSESSSLCKDREQHF
jgi:hypothetical protein